MDGLFTVFGLGTAFGVFCSWMYDVIRKRNQPVARGDSFEAFHGKDVMPAPEPVIMVRSLEPTLTSDFIGNETVTDDKRTKQPSEMDVTFDVSNVSFSETMPFDTLVAELPNEEAAWVPNKPGTPRVVLLLNKNVVREVRENDFPALMREFGILIDSEQAKIFQNGGAVIVGPDTIQLSQV